jgi:hypothetical protein
MPATITKQVLHDGRRNAVVKATILGDADGDLTTPGLLLDISNDLAMGDRTEVKLRRISGDLGGFTAALFWDATADVRICDLPSGDSDNDWCDIGGLRNNAGAGKTGDILVSTLDLADGAGGTIILYLAKVEGARKIG